MKTERNEVNNTIHSKLAYELPDEILEKVAGGTATTGNTIVTGLTEQLNESGPHSGGDTHNGGPVTQGGSSWTETYT